MAMRAVKSGELWATFEYDGKDCADMGVYNVTSSSTYTVNIEPKFSDQKKNVPMYDGTYYYGTQITGQQFKMDCFAHDLSSLEYNRLRAWLNPRKVGRLILSDQPYKFYLVKPVSISDLAAIPLTSVQTPLNSILGDFMEGDVVYTGNFSITFETVGSAYGYGLSYYRDDLIYDARTVYDVDYYYNSGLLYKDMSPRLKWTVEANANEQKIPMYNPGDAEGYPKYIVKHEGTFPDNSFIQFRNKTLEEQTQMSHNVVIDLSGCNGNIIIDTESQVLQDGIVFDEDGRIIQRGQFYFGKFAGSPVKISPVDTVIELPETFVENIENTTLKEYDSFYIENNVVTVNPLVLKVTEDLVGRYFCVLYNGGSKIESVDVENNTLTLSSDTETYDMLPAEIEEGIVIRPSGFAFNFIFRYIPPTVGESDGEANVGDVCHVGDKWYVYLYDKWEETNLFSSEEEFKEKGEFVTLYRTFGATIVIMDDLVITTGPTLYFRQMGTLTPKKGTNMPEFELQAELLPRYL